MKYLEALKEVGKTSQPSVIPEHKMAPGPRGKLDPKDPESLISSPHLSERRSTQDIRNAARERHNAAQTNRDDKNKDKDTSTLDES